MPPIVARDAVADPGDGIVQAPVSGLAHHAGALVLGYALALVVLALRQVALRNAGSIRARTRVPAQRTATTTSAATSAQRQPVRATVRR